MGKKALVFLLQEQPAESWPRSAALSTPSQLQTQFTVS